MKKIITFIFILIFIFNNIPANASLSTLNNKNNKFVCKYIKTNYDTEKIKL